MPVVQDKKGRIVAYQIGGWLIALSLLSLFLLSCAGVSALLAADTWTLAVDTCFQKGGQLWGKLLFASLRASLRSARCWTCASDLLLTVACVVCSAVRC
jgi:hypothetical protein